MILNYKAPRLGGNSGIFLVFCLIDAGYEDEYDWTELFTVPSLGPLAWINLPPPAAPLTEIPAENHIYKSPINTKAQLIFIGLN